MRFFHLPPQWQREYRPLLAEWFVRRHRERVAELDREADGLQGANLMISGLLLSVLLSGVADDPAAAVLVGVRTSTGLQSASSRGSAAPSPAQPIGALQRLFDEESR
jgi:hypothetical protein